MNHSRTLALAAGLLAASLTALVLLLQSDGEPAPDFPGSSGGDIAKTAAAPERANAADGAFEVSGQAERSAVDVEDSPGVIGLERMPEAPLAVTGRVTDPLGNPIPGAQVLVEHRRRFEFGGGGPGGARGGRGGRFDPGQGDLRARFEELREQFRPRPVSEPAITGADGAYTLRGEAYESADLTIAVRHSEYAPAVERREWVAAMGELRVSDIVLEHGVVVTGVVVDDSDRPVGGAEVRYERDGEDFGFGRGRGPGGEGRRGNRGGAGRAGWFRDPIEAVIDPAITDAAGGFRIGPLPSEPFRLVATAERHLDGRSRRIDAEVAADVPPQRIVAPLAVGLTGIVVDVAGQPIAGAEVTGEVSVETVFAELRAQREARQQSREAGGEPQRQGRGGRQGGGPDRGGMRETMAARESTRTDEKGEFTLEKLPRAPIRLTVEHRSHLTVQQEPVDAARTPHVDVVMQQALALAGTLIDARTGQPVETFGIRARRIDRGADNENPFAAFARNRGGDAESGGRGRFRRGGRDGQEQRPEGDAAEQARQAWLRERLGPAARTPGRTPEPSAHPGGRFALDGLQVGEYVVDVDAPGYVRTALGPFSVDEGTTGTEQLLRVERGGVLLGHVVRTDRTPVEGAVVQLFLPEAPQSGGNEESGRGGRGGGGRGPGGGFGGFGGFGSRLARAVTGADGSFRLPPQRAGAYRLRVDADTLIPFEEPELLLPGPGRERDLLVTMSAGGRVFGSVRNLEPGSGARVLLTLAGEQTRHMTSIDPATGQYEIVGLPPGGYFATVAPGRGGGADGRRALLADSLAQRSGERAPDLFLTEGATVQYDIDAGVESLGSLAGIVRHNGAPAAGMQVRLQRVDPQPATAEEQRGPGNRLDRMAAELLSATVAADGGFSIPSIPPGSYELQVSQSRGGFGGGRGGRRGRSGRGGSVVYRQEFRVAAFSRAEVQVDVLTSELEVKVTAPEGSGGRLRIALVLAAEAGSVEPRAWRQQPSFRMLFVRDGTTGAQDVPPGTYRYEVAGRGITSVTGEVTVVPGQPQMLEVTVEAAPEGSETEAQSLPRRGR